MSSRAEFINASSGVVAATDKDRSTLGEVAFHRMISRERRRSVRSRKSFVLMLLDMGEHASPKHRRSGLRKVLSTMSGTLRETDIVGWYRENSVVGVMFTEIALNDQNAVPAALMSRVGAELKRQLLPLEFHELSISFHMFAEARGEDIASRETHPVVYAGVAAAGDATSF